MPRTARWRQIGEAAGGRVVVPAEAHQGKAEGTGKGREGQWGDAGGRGGRKGSRGMK